MKGDRTKYKRQKERQKVRNRDLSWGESREEKVSKQQETLSSAGLWGVLESQRTTQPGGEKKKKTLTEYAPPQLPVEKVAQTLAGARQGGAGCMLRVRTGPECPEDNLRELM